MTVTSNPASLRDADQFAICLALVRLEAIT
jgi:hypothetical protein